MAVFDTGPTQVLVPPDVSGAAVAALTDVVRADTVYTPAEEVPVTVVTLLLGRDSPFTTE